MIAADIRRIEECLGIQLPGEYRSALESSGLDNSDDEHPEFMTDAQTLISDNSHFAPVREDASVRSGRGPWSALKSFFLFGSPSRRSARYRAWLQEWAQTRRFVVGSDLSEERYFIVLTEEPVRVYCYELETGKSYVVAESMEDWLATVRLRQAESADPD